MAWTTIGNLTFPPLPVTKLTDTFKINANRSYEVLLEFDSDIPQNVFSKFDVNPILYTKNGNYTYFDINYTIDPLKSPKTLLIPLSRHYIGFTTMALELERNSKFYFGGEGSTIKVRAKVESTTFKSWRWG